MDWENIRVYAYYRQDRTVKDNQEFFGDFRKRVYNYRVRPETLKANPAQYLYLAKMSMPPSLYFHKTMLCLPCDYVKIIVFLVAQELIMAPTLHRQTESVLTARMHVVGAYGDTHPMGKNPNNFSKDPGFTEYRWPGFFVFTVKINPSQPPL